MIKLLKFLICSNRVDKIVKALTDVSAFIDNEVALLLDIWQLKSVALAAVISLKVEGKKKSRHGSFGCYEVSEQEWSVFAFF